MNQFINVGNQVLVNIDDISFICPTSAVPSNKIAESIDVSNGTKRAAVFTKSNECLLVDLRYSTLKARLAEHVMKNPKK